MSIINKMLQDLDRRQGMSDTDAAMAMPQVRTVPAAGKDREWFWRIVAALLVAAVAWVAWIAWQLQPRDSIATDQAFKAAQNAPRAAAVVQAPAPVADTPVAAVPAPVAPALVAVAQAPEPVKLAPAIEAPKPAPELEAPAREQPARVAHPSPPKPVAAKPVAAGSPPIKLDLDIPPARILQAPAQAQGPSKVEKRDRVRSAEDRAEAEFRRGAGLLNQGRGGEAEEAFNAALVALPTHEAARQALVAMNLEQRRIEEARRLLQEGVALHPGNTRFASVLARILIERKDYAGALAVMSGVQAPAQGDAEFQAMRGTVLMRLGRHAEAVEAFQGALRGEPQNGAAWMGLGSSFEALGRKPEAADAFRRAAATASLDADTRSYAEQRARQLK